MKFIKQRKQRKLLRQNDITMQTIKSITGLSNGTLARVNKDEYMHLENLEKICECLEAMLNNKIDFGDVIERVSDHESERVEK